MPTNLEKSFTAQLDTQYGNLHLPRISYGQKTLIKRWYYEAFTFDAHVDVSSTLCVHPQARPDQLSFYFRCIDDYYSIYLLTGSYYNNYALSNEHRDLISAFPHDDDQTTYNLLDANNRIVTLDQLEGNTHNLKIQTRGGRQLCVRENAKVGGLVCTGKEGGQVLEFGFDITKRGAR
ncbi:hypothetical protein [Pseudomonas sp.]|jgi:hypothetical protein|uniref:hypothetical protein n=1 Tax=Pseudomonas sp. TaxID=306 RepID=UPI002E35674F|nr:hypothetical protein [Pseudomonas sp.]HEX4547347.1 hypothetical protein [Pseudomonas sp.]